MEEARATVESAKEDVMEAFASTEKKMTDAKAGLLEEGLNEAYDRVCQPSIFAEISSLDDWIDDR